MTSNYTLYGVQQITALFNLPIANVRWNIELWGIIVDTTKRTQRADQNFIIAYNDTCIVKFKNASNLENN